MRQSDLASRPLRNLAEGFGSVDGIENDAVANRVVRKGVPYRVEECLILLADSLPDRDDGELRSALGCSRRLWRGWLLYLSGGLAFAGVVDEEDRSSDIGALSQAENEAERDLVVKTAGESKEDVVGAIYDWCRHVL